MPSCLIVEDNPINWMVMQNQMEKLGVKVIICENGQKALDYCTNNPIPPLILLDGYMPILNGLELLPKLRALPNGDYPFIIFCSSSLERKEAQKSLSLGADCHFPKPLTLEQYTLAYQQLMERLDRDESKQG